MKKLAKNIFVKIIIIIFIIFVFLFSFIFINRNDNNNFNNFNKPIDLEKQFFKETPIDEKFTVKADLEQNLDLLEKFSEKNFKFEKNYVFNDIVKMKISSAGDMYIFKETFLEEKCNFFCGNKKDIVVIDIGSNLCITSLFFATKSSVSCVYAFEPCPQIIEGARQNLLLNPKLKDKIFIFPFGLLDQNTTEYISYKPSASWLTRIYDEKLNKFDYKKIKTNFKKSSDVLDFIINKHRTSKIVLKVDCEGSEYKIFNDLSEKNILNRIDAIILECHEDAFHEKKREDLLPIIMKNNFFCFINNFSENKKLEYIKAVKINS